MQQYGSVLMRLVADDVIKYPCGTDLCFSKVSIKDLRRVKNSTSQYVISMRGINFAVIETLPGREDSRFPEMSTSGRSGRIAITYL